MSEIADALLSAHIEYEMSKVRGEALARLIDVRTAVFFEWLGQVKFGELVTREQIVGVIERYVIDLKVSGGITELAGEMANVVFSSRSSAETKVGEVCDTEAYEEFADKVVGLGDAQRELVRYVVHSPAFAALVSRMLSRMALDFVFRSDEDAAGFPLKNLLATVVQKVIPGFDDRVVSALSGYVERHAGRITRDRERSLVEALDPEWVRQMSDEIWDSVSKKPLAEATSVFTSQDLEDFVVLGYEFWLKFRKTPYFRVISSEVVDQLFVKYGEESVRSVISDMGVTEAMITHELKTFAEPALALALRTGFLERAVRGILEPFYRSEAFETVLARR